MKLLPGVYQVAGPNVSHSFDATAYLLPAGDSLYLIDCGTPEGFAQIVDNIRSLGFDPSRLARIYATHGHYDHVGAAGLFGQAFGTQLYVHALDREQVETGDSERTSASLLYGAAFPPTPVHGVIAQGDAFATDAGSWTVLHTPGHSPGSCCFALEHAVGMRLLIAGDTLHGGYSPLIGSDEAAWRESLRRLTSLHFDCYTLGHTPPLLLCDADRRIASVVQSFANYYTPWFKDFVRTYPY